MNGRIIVGFVAENKSDLMVCTQLATYLRRAEIITYTPVSYSSVKRQLKRVAELDAFRTVVVNGNESSIRYTNTSVRVTVRTEDVIPVISELEREDEGEDKRIVGIVDKLLVDYRYYSENCSENMFRK